MVRTRRRRQSQLRLREERDKIKQREILLPELLGLVLALFALVTALGSSLPAAARAHSLRKRELQPAAHSAFAARLLGGAIALLA
jgi:hypothetical protein